MKWVSRERVKLDRARAEVFVMRRYTIMLSAFVAGVVFVGAGARAEEPLMKQVATIPLDGVEGRFDHFGVDVDGRRLFLAALGNNSVEVIDLAAGKRVSSISGPKKPTGARVLAGSRKLVVASGDDGNVRVYDEGLKLLGTVHDLPDADNVRLDPQGKLVYVGYGDGAIAVVDPEQPKKIADVKLDGHPEAFQPEANGDRIFVNVPSARQIAVINRTKGAVVATWLVREAEANFPMALDEANHRLFVGCRKPAEVLVVDAETGRTVTTVPCCGDTDDLFYDAAAKRIYVTGGEGCISVIEQSDADHYRVAGTVSTAAGARTSCYVPETHTLYVAVPHRGRQRAELRAYQP
jgi:DNA-binding beta-propeller fold protein YncE